VPDEAAEYSSPKRCLARSFRLSRDRWKQKAADRLGQIKALKVKARDLQTSRDLWKLKALHYEQILRDKGLLPAVAPAPDPQPVAPPHSPLEPAAPGSTPAADHEPSPVSKKNKTRRPR
jgi:hypothetical protein